MDLSAAVSFDAVMGLSNSPAICDELEHQKIDQFWSQLCCHFIIYIGQFAPQPLFILEHTIGVR
jgi:hypothetical protein